MWKKEPFRPPFPDPSQIEAIDDPTLPELETAPEPDPIVEALPLLALVIAVLALSLFTFIADSVIHDQTMAMDLSVRSWVHQLATPLRTDAMLTLSFIGGTGLVFISVLTVLALWHWRWRRASVRLTVTLVGALVLDLALKWGFHRPRPVPFYGPVPPTYSFPSGHALFSLCFYGVLAGLVAGRMPRIWLRGAVWAGAVLLIAGVGVSRIYLGVHYPSDVIAGFLAAALWVSAMVAFDRLRARRSSRQQQESRPAASQKP
jgi:undecaprenyl-diphosphatase